MKKTLARLAFVAGFICFSSATHAQMKDTGVFIGGGLSYAWNNLDTNDLENDFGNISIDDAWGFNLFAGYRFIKYLSLEANHNWYDSFKIDTDFGSFDLNVYTLMLDAKVMYPLFENRLVPYVRLGGGFMHAELENEDQDGSAWNIGTGIDYFINQNISIGIEGKYIWGAVELNDVQIEYFVGSFVIGFHF
jgi:opacity protein-like surface antigen